MKTARIGRRLERYELLEQGGAGGFSVVWKARDTTTDAVVALKIPRVAAFTKQLRAEADLLEQARDPQVVGLLAVHLDHDPPFLVMPWIEGGNLPFPEAVPEPEQTLVGLERLLALTRVVDRLHQRGIVHGDLKPGNVRLDPEGNLWLLDLGLGRIQVQTRQGRSLALSLVSVDGRSIAGTLDFMAPELLAGGEASAASDVYGLGVMLHWLITGCAPAFGISPMTLNPYLPPGMGQFLEQVLHSDPEARFSKAGALLRPLEYFVRVERACLRRSGGHEKRRREIGLRARFRRLGKLALLLAVPLLLVSLAARHLVYPLLLVGDGRVWSLVIVPGALLLLFVGLPQINIWVIGYLEARRQDRLEARRRKHWSESRGRA